MEGTPEHESHQELVIFPCSYAVLHSKMSRLNKRRNTHGGNGQRSLVDCDGHRLLLGQVCWKNKPYKSRLYGSFDHISINISTFLLCCSFDKVYAVKENGMMVLPDPNERSKATPVMILM